MHEPDREGSPARAHIVRVRVGMNAELTAAPADEESDGQVDDDEPDCRLCPELDPLRQVGAEEEDGKPEGKQRQRMAKAPGETELLGATSAALASARHERRYGEEVIRVRRVT